MTDNARPANDEIDKQLSSGQLAFDAGLLVSYLEQAPASKCWEEILQVDSFSMLAPDTLALLRAFALEAKQGILEIGSYIGGSSTAIALGLRDSEAKPFLTVEVGGAYLEQPYIPSADIHADWERNLGSLNLLPFTNLFKGWSTDPKARLAAQRLLGEGGKFDLVFLDANGDFWPNFAPFADMFADDCLFVIDDYHSVEGSQEKALNIHRVVNEMVANETFIEYGAVRWSTWFGRSGPKFKEGLEAIRNRGFTD